MPLNEPRYAENSLVVNSTGVEIEKGSVNFNQEHLTEQPESGDKFQPDMDVTLSQRNTLEWTQYQPSFETPALLTNLKFNWKRYNENGVAPSGGISKIFAKAVVIPIGFSCEKGKLCRFQRKALALFDLGASITDGSELLTPVKVTEPYTLQSVSIGEEELLSVRSANGNYNHEVQWPPELEPAEVWINRSAASGQIVCDDLSEATLARLKTGAIDDITITLVNTAEATHDIEFTNCSIRATISGSQVTLAWAKLTD